MRRPSLFLLIALGVATAIFAAQPAPTLRSPGSPDRTIEASSLLGTNAMDIRIEDVQGNVTVYHGMPLLDVLERNGLDVKTMAGERKSAAVVVLATARGGYAVAFSIGELRANRANPKVFLVAETSEGPLPDNEGPVRLIVYGDVVRSAYALSGIEVKALADDAPARKK
jgi:hypothetical protein